MSPIGIWRTGLLAVFTLIAFPTTPSALHTVVGTGKAGFTGDGGTATQSQLDQPFHVSFGRNGVLFVADTNNHAIRRIDPRTQRITTVAGCGRKGYAGDGGPAIAATMNEPYGVVADARDNLFIVDRLNACVRRVDGQTGTISTLAGTGQPGYSGDGGPADRAQLKEPNGLALDMRGGLLIADVSDNRIRRIDLKKGIITTICGTGKRKFAGDGGPAQEASIDGARAIDADRQGNLYICEREGNRIRKIEAKSGTIHTIAGSGKAGYSGDNGPAREASFNGPKWIHVDGNGNLFIVDTENHCIRRIDGRTQIITTVAGNGKAGGDGDDGPPTQARLDRPHGCTTRNGTLYIADTNNHRVRSCPASPSASR